MPKGNKHYLNFFFFFCKIIIFFLPLLKKIVHGKKGNVFGLLFVCFWIALQFALASTSTTNPHREKPNIESSSLR